MASHAPLAPSSSPTRRDEFFPAVPGESNFMHILKLIGLTIVNIFRAAWRVPQAMARGAKDRRRQTRQDVSEAERLDRLRQPWKYLGK